VNTLEDRLRDAYRGATETVRPETIRGLDDRATRATVGAGRQQGWRRRALIPLAAATAVAAVAVLAAVLITPTSPGQQPRHHRNTAALAGRYPKFFVAMTGNGYSLAVRNATTGALVARVSPPRPGLTFAALATGNGRMFVTAMWRAHTCETHLYQFRLTGNGGPTALTPYAVPVLRQQLVGDIAVSAAGRTFGYYTELCGNGASKPSYLAVTDLATGHTRRWAVPGQADVGSLSLTASGRLLGYNIALTKLFASVARVIPTDAAPGTAAQRSRTVARATQFGQSDEINADVITPDGGALYFSTNLTGAALANRLAWQLRMTDLATGRSHVAATFAGLPFALRIDPSGRYLLLQSELGRNLSSPRLARLDIATGQVKYLPAAWVGPDQAATIAW
jgi:hypothetical protein